MYHARLLRGNRTTEPENHPLKVCKTIKPAFLKAVESSGGI